MDKCPSIETALIRPWVMFLLKFSSFTGFLPPAGYLDDTKTALAMPLISYYINHMCNWL